MRGRTFQALLRIFILFLIVYAFLTLLDAASALRGARGALEERQTQLETLRRSNAALRYDIDHARDESSVERLVRERLGMVRPDETIEYPVGD